MIWPACTLRNTMLKNGGIFMISPRKIIYMTKASKYDAKGETSLKISEYSCVDYILLQVLKSFFTGSIAFAAACMLWVCAKWNSLNEYFFAADYLGFAKKLLIIYGVSMGIYMLVVAFSSWGRHKYCAKKRDQFLALLEKI